jgi:hypothetical protein
VARQQRPHHSHPLPGVYGTPSASAEQKPEIKKNILYKKRKNIMEKITRNINLFLLRNATSNKTRAVLFLITLGLFVLSAGAPDATGGM